MDEDPFMHKCCLSFMGFCGGRVEWHHNLIYAGRQVNEKWCIVPVCHNHHMRAENKEVKKQLDRVMMSRATEKDLKQFPRKDWAQLKIWLKH